MNRLSTKKVWNRSELFVVPSPTFSNLLRPSPTFSESKIRILVLTGMRGRVGGDMTVLGAHLRRQLILGATATGAVTTIVPRADPVFGGGSEKVGEGGYQKLSNVGYRVTGRPLHGPSRSPYRYQIAHTVWITG